MKKVSDMVSIIVPVYNVEKYLPRCLDSIIKQTYTNLEIILVDDGSTDETAKICDEYMENDSRIRVFHCQNSGVSKSRNFGLQNVHGKWFGFVDGDDWIEPEFVEILLENAVNNNCSVSACQAQKNTKFSMGYIEKKQMIKISGADECIKNFICGGVSLQGQVWNKLYYTEKYKNIFFDTELKVNEDCIYTYEILKKCDSACVIENELYHWYIREDSACHSRNLKLDFSAADVFLKLFQETDYLNDEKVKQALIFNYVQVVLRVLLLAKYTGKEKNVQIARERCKKMKSRVWKKFDNKMKLKYLIAIHFPFIRVLLNKMITL